MIRAVLFDFGGVLTTGGTRGCIQRFIAAVYGLQPGAIDQDLDLMLAASSGKISEADFFAHMNERHPQGPRLTCQNFLEQADKQEQLFAKSEPVYTLAAKLRANGIKTGILSNIYAWTADELRRRGLYKGFSPVVLSCSEQVAKPDAQIFQSAAKKLGIPPGEILFVDDQTRFKDPAESLGMRFVHAQTPEQIVRDVSSIIQKENRTAL